MAYIQQQLDDEERKRQQEQGAGAPIADQAGAPASGGTVAPNTENKETTGGGGGAKRFTDVRSFLEANRPQAQELAQRVGQNIKSEAETAQKEIQSTGEKFKSQVEQGAVRKAPVEGLIQQAGTRPEDIVKDKSSVETLAKVRDAQFTGPRTLKGTADYATAQQRAQEAQRKAGLAETQSGREELLGLTGRPSSGGLMLDQLLLSQTPEARAALQEAGKSAAGLGQQLETTAAGAEDFARQAEEETMATKNLFGETLGKAKSSFQKQLDERLNQLRSQATERAAKAQQAVTAGSLDSQALQDLGIGAEDLKAIQQAQKDLKSDYGFEQDLANYLQQQGANFNVNQAATGEDLARQRALEEIAGEKFGPLQGNLGGANLNLSQFAGQEAKRGTLGALSERDRQLIDQYYNREDLGNYQSILQNALKREAEYAKGKTFSPLPPPDPKVPSVLEQITDPGTVRQGVEDLTRGLVGQTGSDLLGAGSAALVTPTKIAKDVAQSLIDKPQNLINPIVPQVEALKELVQNPKQAVNNVVNKVSNSIKKAFCFVAGSEVAMEDGTLRPVENVGLGDVVAAGGLVESIRQSWVDENVFDYKGVRVTGYHAVCEDGKWIRVKDSAHAIPVAFRGIVYSIANKDHRLIINGVLFADELETDDYEGLTIDESILELNKTTLNGQLQEVI